MTNKQTSDNVYEVIVPFLHKKRGLSYREIEKITGISKSSVSKYLKK